MIVFNHGREKGVLIMVSKRFFIEQKMEKGCTEQEALYLWNCLLRILPKKEQLEAGRCQKELFKFGCKDSMYD